MMKTDRIDTLLLWSTHDQILSIPKAGGATAVIAQDLPESPAALVTDGGQVYWLEPVADRIRAAPLTP